MVYDIRNGSGHGITNGGADFFNINNTLMFTASNSLSNTEWWKSDGTASGTGIVKEIRSGSDGSYPSYPVAVGNTLYFEANDGTHGSELWKSDGTDAGTVMVHDLRSGGGSDTAYLIHVGTNLFFSAYSGTSFGIYVLNNTFQYNTSAGSGSGGMTNVLSLIHISEPTRPY